VISRRNELGMRRALGALTIDLLKLIVLRGLALAGAGIAIGVTIAWFGAERLQPLLFDSSPRDPVVFGGAVVILMLCAVSACLLPAWRASRVDPALVLRAD
jgi:putative ABC transport system permease protein